MSKRVSSLFEGKISGGGLVLACLLTLAALFGGPSSAAAAATGKVVTVYWQKGSGVSGYEVHATVTTTTVAESVTISGNGIPAGTELYATLEGDGLVYQGTATFTPTVAFPTPGVTATYTINVGYGTGGDPAEVLTVHPTGVLGSSNVPGLTAPMGAVAAITNPTFHWTAPATPLAKYKVLVSGEDLTWNAEVPSTATSTVYAGPSLVAGARYTWAVGAMDSNGNRAENRVGSFVPGANFSGKVTDINGNPLANIEVQAADLAGMDVGAPFVTGADGTYIYAGLAPGEYKIHFDFQAYYWKNRLDRTSADVLTVTAGATTSNINATLRGWGAIAGSVYFPGYKPATGTQVTLLDLNKVPVASVPAVAVPLSASGFGDYYMALIRPGTYYLRFSAPGYVPVDKQVVVVLNQVVNSMNTNATFYTTVPVTLTVQTVGAGSVTSSPVGISCVSGSTAGCSSSYSAGTVVTLTATPTAASTFGGWSGACTGTGNCVVTVDAAKSATATFRAKPVSVRIDGNSTGFFSINTALDALSNVATLQTVRAKAQTFVENVLMVKPGVQVVLRGGYTDTGDAFTTRTATSRTAIDGSLKIRSGKLTADGLVIK